MASRLGPHQAAIFRASPIAFAQDAVEENRGTVALVGEFLNALAADNDVVISNHAWEPLNFH